MVHLAANMAEYISKDDAQVLIDLIQSDMYSINNAKVYISIMDRLQKYIKDPDEKMKEERIR